MVARAGWPLTHQLRDTKMYSRERDRGRSSVTLHGLAVTVRGCSLCPAVSAHPVLREMGHRCGLWPEEGRGHVLSGARQGEAGAAVFGKHGPASPSAQTLPLNVVLGKNS